MKVINRPLTIEEEDILEKQIRNQGKLNVALFNLKTDDLVFDEFKVKEIGAVSGHPFFNIELSEKNIETFSMLDLSKDDEFTIYTSDIDAPFIVDKNSNSLIGSLAFVSADEITMDIIKIFRQKFDEIKNKTEEEFDRQCKQFEAQEKTLQALGKKLTLQERAASLDIDTELLQKYKLTKVSYLELIDNLDRYYKKEELGNEDETTAEYINSVLQEDGVISLAYTDTTTIPALPIEVEYDLKDRHMKTYVDHELVEDIEFNISDLDYIEFSGLVGEWEEYDKSQERE